MMNRTGRRFVHFPASFLLLLAVSCATDPLEKPGDYDVYSSEPLEIVNPEDPERPIGATVYAPSDDGGESIAEGVFELVILMPGFGASYAAYAVYATHLASHGTIVLGMNFVQDVGFDGRHDYLARQATYVLDFALDGFGPLSGHVDDTKIATAGHSLGGKVAFYAAVLDPRIRVVMAMDPSNGGGPPCFISDEWCNAYPVAPNVVTGDPGLLDGLDVASFIMRAAPDGFNPDPQSNAQYFFQGSDGEGTYGVGSPALYFDIGTGGHASWLYLGNLNVPRITKRTLAAWIRTHFRGEDMEAYLTGDVVQRDLDAGNLISVETR